MLSQVTDSRPAARDRGLAYETNNYSPRLAEFFDPPVRRLPPLAEQLEAAAGAGFGSVVLDSGSLAAYLRDTGTVRELRTLLDELGLRCLAVAEVSIVEDSESTIAAARTLLDAGRVLGVTLQFIADAELCNTRLLLDSWHFFQGSASWAELQQLLPCQIAYLQLSDHAAIGVENPLHATVNERLLPGSGAFDLVRFCAELREAGFDGALSSEVLSSAWRERTPSEYARAEFAALRRYRRGRACSA